jgi:hypothetical protein
MAFHAAGDKAAVNIQMQLFPKLSTCSPGIAIFYQLQKGGNQGGCYLWWRN